MAAVWERQLRTTLFSSCKFVRACRLSQIYRRKLPKILVNQYQTGRVCRASDDFKNMTEDDWRKRLSPEQYHICREKGTESRWSGELLNNKQIGTYSCVGCDADLFHSSTKFDSQSGWPSFWSAIEHEQSKEEKQLGLPNLSVNQVMDESHGMVRVEVVCNQCGSHLGHVFNDGPKPSGLRYCINSMSLKFKPS